MLAWLLVPSAAAALGAGLAAFALFQIALHLLRFMAAAKQKTATERLQERETRERIKLAVEVLTCIGVLIYAYFACGQTAASKRSADAAVTAARIADSSLRAARRSTEHRSAPLHGR